MRRNLLEVVAVVCFFVFVSQLSCFAAVDFRGFKVSKISPVQRDVGPFFKNLEPKISHRGNVKSFKISISKKPKSKANNSWEGSKKIEFAAQSSTSFVLPVSGQISSAFGSRAHPFRRLRHFHTGVDIRARTGTPILSAAAGRVIYAGWRRGYGLMVKVDHGNGLQTVYAHCSKILVGNGSVVKSGSLIAQVGRTGVTTGSHLHFEVFRGNRLTNPLSLFKR